MNKEEKEKADMRICKLIISTSAIMTSVFTTIGLVMAQLFSETSKEIFYEVVGWSMSLAIPFIIPTIISVLIVGYHRKLPRFSFLRNVSIFLYVIAWIWLIINIARWSPYWVKTMMGLYLGLVVGLTLIYIALRQAIPSRRSTD